MSKHGFKELLVWQRAKKLAVHIYELSETGALGKDYGLKDQIRRSAISIPSNIAEGDERGTDRESVRFFYIAKGSLAELVTQLEIAKEIGHLSGVQIEPIETMAHTIGKMLGSLIKSRSRQIPKPWPILSLAAFTFSIYFGLNIFAHCLSPIAHRLPPWT